MITGIISEFNPITNGHAHIISTAKANGGFVVCVMSGNFVQRGECAIFSKHVRARMALSAGADMVLELPVQFSCSNAETFAFGAVKILSLLGADKILFGSESGDIQKLKLQADFAENEKFKKHLAKNLAKGETFAKAKSDAHEKSGSEMTVLPNDILGVEYIKAGKKLGFAGDFQTIPRVGSGHDSIVANGEFASASHIRELILSGETEKVANFMPKGAFEILKNSEIVDSSNFGLLASYQGVFGKNRSEISEVTEGLENLMFQTDFDDFTDYAMCMKSKRYTLAKIKRISVKSVLDITKSDVKFAEKHVKFAKVLAVKKESTALFSKESKLKLIRRGSDVESLSKKQKTILKKMQKADMVYSIFSKQKEEKMVVE